MSKNEAAKPTREDRVLEDALLRHAAGQTGYVFKPYPSGMDGAAADLAVARLREKGLVHGSRREPNLTPAGIDATRENAA